MYPIFNARDNGQDKEIVKVERERKNGILCEYQYNKDGVCLVAKIIEEKENGTEN